MLCTVAQVFRARGGRPIVLFASPFSGGSLGTRPSKNRKGGSGTSAGVEVYTAEC